MYVVGDDVAVDHSQEPLTTPSPTSPRTSPMASKARGCGVATRRDGAWGPARRNALCANDGSLLNVAGAAAACCQASSAAAGDRAAGRASRVKPTSVPD